MKTTSAPQGNWTQSDAATLWAALVEDTNNAVSIVDTDGTIEFMNETLASWFSKAPAQFVGAKMSDVLPPNVANERLMLVREVASTGDAVIIEGMLNAVWRRTTYRRVPGTEKSGKPRVMCVYRPAQRPMGASAGTGIRTAVNHDLGRLAVLTSRELDILRLIGEGLSTADIGKRLHRSVKTVEWHRVSLGNKLGVTNRVELARIAIRAGLANLDTDTLGSAKDAE